MVNAADGAIRRTLHSQTRGGGRGAGDSEKWRMHSASLVFEIISFMICKTCAHASFATRPCATLSTTCLEACSQHGYINYNHYDYY